MINATLGTGIRTARITIPAATDVGTTLGSLLAIAQLGPAPLTVEIAGVLSDGTTQRAAFVYASPRQGATPADADYSTHGRFVPASVDWRAPPGDQCGAVLIRAAAGLAFPAIVTAVY